MEIKTAPQLETHFSFAPDLYIKPIIPYLSKNHLDIGCGEGAVTSRMAYFKPESNIIGFDLNKESIEDAKLIFRFFDNLSFTSNEKDLSKTKVNSASAIFVYHEANQKIFEIASNSLKQNNFFTVVDYNIKNIGLAKFKQIFTAASELLEVEELGLIKACVLHTKMDLGDCIQSAENNGFKTVDSKRLNEKYFFWVGQKL